MQSCLEVSVEGGQYFWRCVVGRGGLDRVTRSDGEMFVSHSEFTVCFTDSNLASAMSVMKLS